MWNATNWHVDFLLFVGVVQVTGNLLLLLGSISLGLLAYLVSDSRQRRAFLDTRQSFEMRLTIEEQAREQVNICWFSIFPGSVQWSLTNGFSFLGTRRLFCILLFFWDFDGLRRVDGPWHSFNHRPRWFLPLFFTLFNRLFGGHRWRSSSADSGRTSRRSNYCCRCYRNMWPSRCAKTWARPTTDNLKRFTWAVTRTSGQFELWRLMSFASWPFDCPHERTHFAIVKRRKTLKLLMKARSTFGESVLCHNFPISNKLIFSAPFF